MSETNTVRASGLPLWLTIGVALWWLAAALALHDLANANRPHELEKVPIVTGILVVNLFVQLRAALALRARLRDHSTNRLAILDVLLVFVTAVYQVFSVIFLFLAGSTWVEQLT